MRLEVTAVVEFEVTEDVLLSIERRLISDLSDLVDESVSLLLRTLLLFSTISTTWFVRGAEVASDTAVTASGCAPPSAASLFSKTEDVAMEVEAVEVVVDAVTEVMVKVGTGGSSLISETAATEVEDFIALVEGVEAVASKGLSRLPPPTKCSFSCMAGDLFARGCLVLGMDFFCDEAAEAEAEAAADTSISRGCSEPVAEVE